MRPAEKAKALGIQLWSPEYTKGKGVGMKQTDDGSYVDVGEIGHLLASQQPVLGQGVEGLVAERLWSEARGGREPRSLAEASAATQEEFRSVAADIVAIVQAAPTQPKVGGGVRKALETLRSWAENPPGPVDTGGWLRCADVLEIAQEGLAALSQQGEEEAGGVVAAIRAEIKRLEGEPLTCCGSYTRRRLKAILDSSQPLQQPRGQERDRG